MSKITGPIQTAANAWVCALVFTKQQDLVEVEVHRFLNGASQLAGASFDLPKLLLKDTIIQLSI